MKRSLPDGFEPHGLPKRGRTDGHSPASLTEDPDFQPEVYDDNDDDDADYNAHDDADKSQHVGTASSLPTNAPPTPLSIRPKFPSEYKTIKCTYPNCDKLFNRPVRLEEHLRTHTGERPHKCTYAGCSKDYYQLKHLQQHIRNSHTKDQVYICTHKCCGKKFATPTRLRRHQAVHEGEERHRCREFPPCNQIFRKRQTLQRHIRSAHLQVPAYQCNHKDGVLAQVCGEGFESQKSLDRHQAKKHEELRFWCEECAKDRDQDGDSRRVGFRTAALMQVHMSKVHVSCAFCGVVCKGRPELEEHHASEHAEQLSSVQAQHTDRSLSVEERKDIACTWQGCTKTFTKKSNLNVHIRSYHQGLRFICGDTDLSGTKDLASWPWQHQGCGDGFVTKANLENHVRYVHLKIQRPAQPTPSLTGFTTLDNMVNVLAGTGAGEEMRQTLSCTMGCGLRFTHPSELDAHIRSQHSVEQRLVSYLGPASSAPSIPMTMSHNSAPMAMSHPYAPAPMTSSYPSGPMAMNRQYAPVPMTSSYPSGPMAMNHSSASAPMTSSHPSGPMITANREEYDPFWFGATAPANAGDSGQGSELGWQLGGSEMRQFVDFDNNNNNNFEPPIDPNLR